MRRHALFVGAAAVCLAAAVAAQSDRPQGTTYRSPGGTTLRLMLDETNLGAEASVGEMIFPPNTDSGDHQHGAIEIFYVVSGQLEHVVNGRSELLKPGMAGTRSAPSSMVASVLRAPISIEVSAASIARCAFIGSSRTTPHS